MRLLDPSPGEMYDRETILLLKVDACMQQHRSVGQFVDELTSLNKVMNEQWISKLTSENGPKLQILVDELSTINTRLWKLEDEIRDLRGNVSGNRDKLADIGVEISFVNDTRADLVKRINHLFGIALVEKLHK